MRAFIICALALLALIAIPFTGLLAFWAMMAESGGKNSHPEVVPIMLWGIAELIATLVASVRYRSMPLPAARLRLALGLVLTLIVWPSILAAAFLLNGREWTLTAPYVQHALSCRVARAGLAPGADRREARM
jgi:uncharacterized membrane protein